jgi:hypothetical protein
MRKNRSKLNKSHFDQIDHLSKKWSKIQKLLTPQMIIDYFWWNLYFCLISPRNGENCNPSAKSNGIVTRNGVDFFREIILHYIITNKLIINFWSGNVYKLVQSIKNLIETLRYFNTAILIQKYNNPGSIWINLCFISVYKRCSTFISYLIN